MSRLFALLCAVVCLLALFSLVSAQQQGVYTGSSTPIPIPNASTCQNARGLAVDSAGLIYIACGGNSSIIVMDQSGNYQRSYTVNQGGYIWNPFGIAFSGNTMYVSSLYDSIMYQLNTTTGAVITSWTTGLNWPWGVAVDSSSNVWVANYGGGTVLKFSPGGTTLMANFSTTAPAMYYPEEIAIDSSGNVLVVDTDNNRVVKFSPSGNVLATYNNTTPALNEPGGIALDSQGSIYVCDTWNYAVVKLNSQGQQIETLVQLGSGQYNISAAAGLAIDSSNYVYVLDSLTNNRVLKFPPTLYKNGQSVTAAVSAFAFAIAAAVALALL